MRLDRMLAIVLILLNRRRATAPELAERFGVSVRTIYRDIDTIDGAGIPIVSFQGQGGGFGIVESYRLERQLLTPDDMLAMLGVLRGVGSALKDQQLDVSSRKIESLIPEPERRRLSDEFAVSADDRFVLYPVRCIRRKNVGEALLYGKLAPPGTVVGVTLPPLNPVAIPVYARWQQLAAEWELPCRFDVGVAGKLTFAESLAASDLILTTSVAEGFGMVFLESWLASRALVGRDLPEITADFKKVIIDIAHCAAQYTAAYLRQFHLQRITGRYMTHIALQSCSFRIRKTLAVDLAIGRQYKLFQHYKMRRDHIIG